jgi:DNA ligase-1
MMHGQDWRGEDLAGWFMSEKLHGCRAYWDGAALWSRGDIAIEIPAAWRAELPASVTLDCEMYAGVGRFNAAQAAIVYGRFSPDVRLMVFDADVPGEYLQRQARIRNVLKGAVHAAPVEYRCCHSTADALTWLRRIRAAGGEGVMAINPVNAYAAGRTRQVLKLTGKTS